MKPWKIWFDPSPKQRIYIDRLVDTELCGEDAEEVVKRLICEGLERRICSGLIRAIESERPLRALRKPR